MPESELIQQIFECAQTAEVNADEAMLHSDLPNEHPTFIALRGAHDALKRIRAAIELSNIDPMDSGQL